MEGTSLQKYALRWLNPIDVGNELEDWRYAQHAEVLVGKRCQILCTLKVGCRILPLGYLIAEDLALEMNVWQLCLGMIKMFQGYPVKPVLMVEMNDFIQFVFLFFDVVFARADPIKISSDVIGPVLHIIQTVPKYCQLFNGPLRLALDP